MVKSIIISKRQLANLVSSFMSIKYDYVGGVRDIVLEKVQVAERFKELNVPMVDEFLIYHLLSLLHVQFDQLKVTFKHRKINGTSIDHHLHSGRRQN